MPSEGSGEAQGSVEIADKDKAILEFGIERDVKLNEQVLRVMITKADGTKYGKTEGGALWLDPEMMSPYAFHQFWLNVEDEKVGELLRIFTFLSHEEIEALEAETAEKPFLRAGQKALADAVYKVQEERWRRERQLTARSDYQT